MPTNINLRSFTLANNHEMTYVNLRNWNNANNMIVEINSSNENIECIQVDDPQAVIARLPPYQWWDIDPSFTLSEDCPLGVNDFDISQISVYSNPVTARLNIESNEFVINSVNIYDALGRLVQKENYDFDRIDVSSLSSGFLFLEINTDHGVLVKKSY